MGLILWAALEAAKIRPARLSAAKFLIVIVKIEQRQVTGQN